MHPTVLHTHIKKQSKNTCSANTQADLSTTVTSVEKKPKQQKPKETQPETQQVLNIIKPLTTEEKHKHLSKLREDRLTNLFSKALKL